MFHSLLYSIRLSGVAAPIFVSVASKCSKDIEWASANPIANAQKSLPSKTELIFQGVNSDLLMGPTDRVDGCHFSRSGQEKFANAWVEVLKSAR